MAPPFYEDEPEDRVECILCGDVEDPRDMQYGEEIGESGMVCRCCVRLWYARVRKEMAA